jgi:GT2 family glycosyltransferase
MAVEFSVIIVNWNARAHLARCLQALARQIHAPLEVLLVDNASSDDSVDYVRRRHPEVRLLAQTRNLGFAAANNLAVRRARGEWVALLNPDAFPEPDWLAGYAEAIREHPDCACFTGRLLDAADPACIDGSGDVYHVSGLSWRRDHGRPVAAAERPSGPVFSACGASAVYRREVFLGLGGFDEDFFCYMEDVDLGFRLRLAGEVCHYVPAATALHLGSGTTALRSDFSVFHGHRNLVWVFVKDMPGPLFWLYLPLHLLLNLASILWLARRGQGRVALRAKRAALRGLPRIWRRRAEVQSHRRASARAIRQALLGGVPWNR